MPVLSDAQHVLPLTMSDALSPSVPSTGDMNAQLQLLLDSKEKELQQVGTLGQRILSQQVQLDERVRQLRELEAERVDNQSLDPKILEQYRELTEMVKAWETDNIQLTQSLDSKVRPFSCPSFNPGKIELSRHIPSQTLHCHRRYQERPTFLKMQKGRKLVRQLQSNPGVPRTLLIVQMIPVSVRLTLVCYDPILITYCSCRVRFRDWGRSPHRGSATAKFARGT